MREGDLRFSESDVTHCYLSFSTKLRSLRTHQFNMKVFEGNLDGKDCSIGIVVSKFNDPITSRLQAGAQEALQQLGTPSEKIQLTKTS